MTFSKEDKTHGPEEQPGTGRSISQSAWGPLRQPLFRGLWVATVVSNIGTWMQNVGAAWLMTTLAPSPLMVALVQSATSAPIFLLGLPAGALADVADRRRLLLLTQGWMLLAAAVLGVLTIAEGITPWPLLAFTFLLGLGSAMNAPAWQAIVPELVERPHLPAAVALNSVGFNLARVIGPALGGIIIAFVGAGATFLLNAASFLGVILVLYRWRRPSRESVLPAERIIGAVWTGLRYVRNSPPLIAVLVRAGTFMFCASALWALLPLVAKQELGHGSASYGVLLGSLGLGAVVGSAILPLLRQRISLNQIVSTGTLLFAAVTLALACLRNYFLLCATMGAGGVAWIFLMASLNVAAQTAVPSWVRARALAVYLLTFQGGMAVGSAFWGSLAERSGIAWTLLYAALGLIASLSTQIWWRLQENEGLDLTPSLRWREPVVSIEPAPEQGPVLVTVEYRIDLACAHEFVKAMHEWSRVRRRDGAIRWGLFNDTSNPGCYLETFLVESWAEHLRQHERVTMSDRVLEDRVRAFHIGEKPPAISHLIYASEENAKG